MATTNDVLSKRWRGLWLGNEKACDAYVVLTQQYASNALPYHNLEHVAACLDILDANRHLADFAQSVEIAIWYRSAAWDPRRHDNGRTCARFANEQLVLHGMKVDGRSRVMDLIEKSVNQNLADSRDEKLTADIVNRILGGSLEDYARYKDALRRERKHLKDDEYRVTRIAELAAHLRRRSIFRTTDFIAKFERSAHTNIDAEINSLLKA